MAALILGAVLFVIALILGGVHVLSVYNIYGDAANRLYFYGAVATIGIVGIMLSVWSMMKKRTQK